MVENCEYLEYCGECKYEKSDKPCLRRPSFHRQLIASRLPSYQWTNTKLIPDDIDIPAYDRLAEIADTIVDRVQTPGSKNLVICGANMGNGKTSWAVKLLKYYLHAIAWSAYLDEYPHGAFVLTSQYIMDAKAFDVADSCHKRYIEVREAADKADFTVWDDIGSAEYTRYDYINLLVPIERRIFAGKFNVFTTNFTEYDNRMISRLGDRLANRIWQTSEIIELRGEGARC